MTYENDKITVSVSFDKEKVLTSTYVDGKIVKFDKPIIGGWCIEARPKEEGSYIEGIGVYSVIYELKLEDALGSALEYLTKTL